MIFVERFLIGQLTWCISVPVLYILQPVLTCNKLTLSLDDFRLIMIEIRCDAETISTENGMIYSWPTTLARETATLTCQTRSDILVMRNCSSEGVWQNVTNDGCDTVNEQLLGLNRSFANVLDLLSTWVYSLIQIGNGLGTRLIEVLV